MRKVKTSGTIPPIAIAVPRPSRGRTDEGDDAECDRRADRQSDPEHRREADRVRDQLRRDADQAGAPRR